MVCSNRFSLTEPCRTPINCCRRGSMVTSPRGVPAGAIGCAWSPVIGMSGIAARDNT